MVFLKYLLNIVAAANILQRKSLSISFMPSLFSLGWYVYVLGGLFSLSLLDFTFCGLNFLFRTGQADDVTGSGLLHSRGIFLVKLLGNEIMREY